MELPRKEGRVVDTKTVRFVQQCELSLFDGPSASFTSHLGKRYNLITCSNKFGYVFAIHPVSKDLAVFQSKKIDVSAASKSTRAGILLNSQSLDAKHLPLSACLNDPTHLQLSDDELTLIICGNEASSNMACAYLFSVPDVASGYGNALIGRVQLSSDPNVAVVSVTIRPMADSTPAAGEQQRNDVPSALAIFSDGSLCHFSVQKAPTVLGTLPTGAGVTSVSWSRKGKQFVVGDKTGRLVRFEPSGMKAKAAIPAPNPNISVCDLLWLDNYNYVAAYLAIDGSNPQPQVIFVNTRAEQPVFTDFGDICYGTDDDMSHPRQYFFWHIHEWRLVLALSQTALEGSLLSYNQSEQSWEQLIVEDENCRLTFPADPTSPSYPVGMVLSLSSQHPVIAPPNLSDDPQATQAAKIPPSPFLLVSMSTGVIMAFSVVNSARDAANLTKDAVALPNQPTEVQPPIAKPTPVVAVPPISSPINILQQKPQLQQPQPVKPQPVQNLFVKAPSPVATPAQPQQPQVQQPQNPASTTLPPVQSTPQPVQKQANKVQMEQELDNFVAGKLAEEVAAINELYGVWCKSVKPLLDRESTFNAQMEGDRQHFCRLLAEINSQLDEYRASLTDLESGFKLLSARLVDGLARAEESRLAIAGSATSPVNPVAMTGRLALSPKHISSVAPTTSVSPNIRDRLKQTSVSVTQQLFASCGQQLTRLREMKKSLDFVYDSLVAKTCEGESGVRQDDSGSVKNIYEAAHGLQKAVHLQKLFVAELQKKLGKLKLQVASEQDLTGNQAPVTVTVLKSFCRTQVPERAPSKLRSYLMSNHRMNCITVAPQPSFTEIGKTLPKLPVKKVVQQLVEKQQEVVKGISFAPPVVTVAHAASERKPKVGEIQPQPENLSTHQPKPSPNLFGTGFTGFGGGGGLTQGQPITFQPPPKVEQQKPVEKEPLPVPKEVPKQEVPKQDQQQPPIFVAPSHGPAPAGPSSLPLFRAPIPAVAKPVAVPEVSAHSVTTASAPTTTSTVTESAKSSFSFLPQSVSTSVPAPTVTTESKSAFGFLAPQPVPVTTVAPTTTTTTVTSESKPVFGLSLQQPVISTTTAELKPVAEPQKAPPSFLASFLSDQPPAAPLTTTTAPSVFQQVPTVTTTTAASTSTSSVFGFAAPSQPPPSTTAAPSSVFSFAPPSTTTAAASIFTTPTTTTTAPSSLFAPSPTSTSATSSLDGLLAQPTTTTTSTASAFSFAPLATTAAPTSSSVFGFVPPASSAPSSVFSFAPQPAPSTVFGQPVAPAPAAAVTSEPLFGGLFSSSMSEIGKPNAEKPAGSGPFGFMSTPTPAPATGTNIFGGGAQSATPSSGFSFAAPKPAAGSLFSSSALSPATTTAPSAGFSFAGGAAFGGAQQPATGTAFGTVSAFGGSPSFGGVPAFGTSPSFGTAPAFGSTPAFGGSTGGGFGGFGGQPSGGSVFGGSSGGQSGFAALASTGTGAFGGGGGNSSPTAPSFTQYRG